MNDSGWCIVQCVNFKINKNLHTRLDKIKNVRINKMETRKELTLIPKTENYIKYMLNVIVKLPRTEKFSIGNEYKNMMYKMLEEVMMLGKVVTEEKMNYINKIDARINVQRVFLRIMQDNKWIDEKNFYIACLCQMNQEELQEDY